MLNGRKFLIVVGCKEWDSEYPVGAETAARQGSAWLWPEPPDHMITHITIWGVSKITSLLMQEM